MNMIKEVTVQMIKGTVLGVSVAVAMGLPIVGGARAFPADPEPVLPQCTVDQGPPCRWV